MLQEEIERTRIGILKTFEAFIAPWLIVPEHEARQTREFERERHHERSAQHIGDRKREGQHHLVHNARGENDRQENADGGKR